MFRSLYLRASVVLALSFCSAVQAADADQVTPATSRPSAAVPAPKVDTSQGPTVIRRRMTLIEEYTRLPDDDYRNRFLAQLTWSFGEKRDYGLTVEVPFVKYDPSGLPGEQSAAGLGDLRMFFIHPFAVRNKLIHAYALEAYFDTASKQQLGVGATTLLPSYALTYRHSKNFQAILLMQYQFDVQRDAGVSPTSMLALRPFFIINFPNYWYSFLEGKATMDFERDNDIAVTFNASLGKFLGEKRKVSVFGVVGMPLNSYARDVIQKYQFKLGMNYFF